MTWYSLTRDKFHQLTGYLFTSTMLLKELLNTKLQRKIRIPESVKNDWTCKSKFTFILMPMQKKSAQIGIYRLSCFVLQTRTFQTFPKNISSKKFFTQYENAHVSYLCIFFSSSWCVVTYGGRKLSYIVWKCNAMWEKWCLWDAFLCCRIQRYISQVK